MDPVQSASKYPKTPDTPQGSGSQGSSPSPPPATSQSSDEDRLKKIKKELDRLKDQDSPTSPLIKTSDKPTGAQPTPAMDIVKPGSFGSPPSQTDTSAQDQSKKTGDEPPIKEEEKVEGSSPLRDVDAGETKTKKGVNFVNNLMLVLGPLFLVGALGFSYYNLRLKPQPYETYTAGTGIEIKNQDDYAKYAPFNPTEVKAYADSTKQIKLQSGQAYSYDNPYFEWSGAKTNEPKTKITSYLVSFGKKHSPSNPSASVKKPSFSPKEHGITLQKGETYKLFVQTVTKGQASLGFDRQAKVSAVAIFEYKYQ